APPPASPAPVTGPRTRPGRRHPLVAILVLAAAAVLAGGRSGAAIAEWAADAPQPVRAPPAKPPRSPPPPVRAPPATPPRSPHRPLGVGGPQRNHDPAHPGPA